jgi:hypothetical protein
MRSMNTLGNMPASLPLAADDITEFHAARLLLLLHLCGNDDMINGLTKLAKLDFFIRYPDFFERIARHLGQVASAATQQIESVMVRHHYGPWDKRYYQILGFLEARGLMMVSKHNNSYDFVLTPLGHDRAKMLSKNEAYRPLADQMKAVKKLLGRKRGTQLKDLVYKVFDEEVKQRKIGEVIL